MNNIYDDGVAIDRKAKEHMDEHPGTSYRAALRALIREEDAMEKAVRKEFGERVEREVSAGYKDYAFACERVLRSDPANMWQPYAFMTNQSELARRAGEVISQGKRDSGRRKITLAQAVTEILQAKPDEAKYLAGSWLDKMALAQINNANLGSEINRAYPIALARVRSTYPEADQQYQTGAVTNLSMRTIFRQWFKD